MLDTRLVAVVRGHVRQVETFSDLQLGHYNSATTVGETFAGCLLGLGVADHLDGEVVAVDGEVWRIPADGVPVVAPPTLGMPFAIAASGGRSRPIPLEAGLDLAQLGAYLDGLRQALGASVVATRMDGTFTDVVLRSEHRQRPPYDELTHVLEHEVRFPHGRWSGSLVGFCFDDAAEGVAIPGLHLHGVAFDRGSGGHCLAATTAVAALQVWVDDVEFIIP